MKNALRIFAVITVVAISLVSCQKEIDFKQEEVKVTHTIKFVAENPETKTNANIINDGQNVQYSWTEEDENRFTVYEIVDGKATEGEAIGVLSEGRMSIMAEFEGELAQGASYQAVFNGGVKATQNTALRNEGGVWVFEYDQESDVLISELKELTADDDIENLQLRFKREVAISQMTLKGLTVGEKVSKVVIKSTDDAVLAADYIYADKGFTANKSTSITLDNIELPIYEIEGVRQTQMRFVSLPLGGEGSKLRIFTSTTDNEENTHMYVKTFTKGITFEKGNMRIFNVSGFTEVTTRATFNINGEETSKLVYESEPIEFPEAPATIAGYDFVGWGTSPISGTQAEAPELVETSTEVMGNADVTYYAVYAKTTGHGTATHTITYDTENIPSSYGASADVVLNGVTFNVTQMYKNGQKMQWHASDGTIYNKDAFSSIQSVAITYTNDDTRKNFTVKVGDSANPTSGTEITPAQVGETLTYIYDCSASASDYFVLANGSNAGYLTSIVITYLGGAPTYEDYCTSIDTRTVTSLAWSAPTATVKLNGDDNEYPELTGDPEEVLAGVVYSSSETSVADIDESGVVTLKAVGETTITAAFPDGDKDYQPSSASYTLVVTAPAKHTVTFSINGNTSSEEVDENDPIDFPNVPEISGVVFRGWTKAAIVGTQAQAPDMVDTDEETMGNADVTYYAVFATETEGQEKLVETVGFESSEGYTATSTYNSQNYTTGSTGSKWTINYGAFATNGAIIGSQSAQFRVYSSGGGYGDLKNTVAYTEDIVKVAFSAKAANTNGQVKVSYSANGSSWTDITTQSLTTTTTEYSCDITATGVRYIKFTAVGTKPSSGNYSIYVDGVKITSKSAATYSDYCTTVVTLSSVVVSGTASKTNYKVGDSFDFTGLVATAVYSDGSEVVVTGDAQWAPTSALAADATSVNVTATYNDVTSADFPVSITVANFNGITVKTAPTKVTYTEGEMFDPSGLVITKDYSDGSHEDVTYSDDNKDDFSFSPNLTTPLATSDVQVTITYQGKSANQAITVNEIPAIDTMDGIFAAAQTAGSTAADIKVKFTNCVITAVKNNNAYLTDNAGKGLIIYTASHGFAVNDKLNGTVNCKVQLYNGAAELTALTSTTEGLTVTKDGVVTPQSIAIANLSGVNTGAVLTFESLKYNGSAFSDGENTITPYNTFITLPTLTSGRNYQVNGVYIQFNSNKEIAPRSEADFVIIEDPYLTATAGKTTGIAAAGETITVTVATNVSTGWDASSNNAAFVISNKAADSFDVEVAKNEDTDNTKSATITVTATGVPSVEITLTQDKAPKAGETTVSWVASEQGYTNGEQYTSATVDSNISLAFGDGGNDGKYYTTGSGMRLYSNGKMTVSAKSGITISNIEVTYSDASYTGTMSASVGSYSLSDNIGTWSGSANSVVLTNTATSGHARIQKVIVTYTSGGAPTPPTPTVLSVPSNLQSSNVAQTTATLAWDAVANASSYTVMIGSTVYTNVNTNSYSATGLTAGTQYTWTVKAIGDGVNYTSSAYASDAQFTTISGDGPTTHEVTHTLTSATSPQNVDSNVTLSFDANSGTAPAWYDPEVRTYEKNKTTLSCPGGNITKIVFTYTISNSGSLTASTGTYNGSTKTWTGSAESVSFTTGHSSGTKNGQVRISKIVVTYTK